LDWAAKLAELQDSVGSVGATFTKGRSDAFTTICRGYGDGPVIEATSFAILAWLRSGDKFENNITKAIQWLHTKCSCGQFGATQSTVMALKAIVEDDRRQSHSADSAEMAVHVTLNGEPLHKIPFSMKQSFIVEVPDFSDKLKAGQKYTLGLAIAGVEKPVPYSFSVNFFRDVPDNHPDCAVQLTTKLASDTLKEGDGSEVAVTVTNVDKKDGLPMVIARIGLPGGLEPRHAQLQELVRSNIVTYYEVRSREVDIYLQHMLPAQQVTFKIDVVAVVPGTYTGAASSAYLYYTPEQKHWNAPIKVDIQPAVY